jgi:hypothetical protein
VLSLKNLLNQLQMNTNSRRKRLKREHKCNSLPILRLSSMLSMGPVIGLMTAWSLF